MTKSNTDVPASIAGYFYQFLLAVREISNLLSNGDINDLVGIEQGADVRVFKQGNNKKSVEAKFYKNFDFSRTHSSICHTIYNFYTSFLAASEAGESIDDYEYHTNVPITEADKQFFDRWNTFDSCTDEEKKEYITYIKESIIRDRLNTNRAKEVIPQMEAYIQKRQMETIFLKIIDGTSDLIPLLQKTEEGEAAYLCLQGSDLTAKEQTLREVIDTQAYTKPRSRDRRNARPLLDKLQESIKKPSREQLITQLLNGEMTNYYKSLIFYKVDDEKAQNKKGERELDITADESFEVFARNVSFHFGSYTKTKKIDYINDLQQIISQQLQGYDPSLQPNDCQKIINAVIEKLFRTTVDNTLGISVSELRNMIQDHNDIIENGKLTMIMESYNNVMRQNRRMMKHLMDNDTAIELEQRIVQSWERYYESASQMGVSKLNKSFKVNQNEISIDELLEILIHISLLEHYGEQPLSVFFNEELMSGANNVELATNKQYLFKTIKGTFYKKTEHVVYEFIDYMYQNHLEKINGNEHVLFFSDVVNPTHINIEEESFILNIAQVDEQENLLLLFGDMNFSWNSQIDLDESHEKNKQSVINFIGD